MEHIIKAAVERGASDLHIKAGDVFRARINGVLKPLTKQRLTPEQTKAIAMELVPTDYVRDQLDTILDYDCSWGAPGIGRFRVNILRQRSSFMVVMRVIPFDVPSLEKLRLPPVVQGVAELDHGLVLVTGPTGSGKSSTVAALIHHINSQMNKHVITVESPIEFLHRDLKGSVTQREVGVDTDNLASGLQSSLRQDPDVVVVQELLDHEMVDAALTAAETGRLVISTLHTPDATTTVSRLVALFGHDEREVARIRIADAMGGVISQRLLSTSDGQRCVAAEIAIASPAMRSVVRDRHRAGDMYQLIADSRETSGMQTLDQHLVDLVNHGVVEYDLAIAACTNEEEFRRLDAMVRERLADDSESSERRSGRRTRRHGPRDRRRRRDTSQGHDT